MPERTIFVGYSSPEDLLKAIDRAQPVYGHLISETVPSSSSPIEFERFLIVIAQPDNDGLVHYCRIPLGGISHFYGPPNPNHKQKRLAVIQAWELTRVWLTEQGLTVREAIIAAPRDYQYLDGSASFLLYDQVFKNYYRQEAVDD